MAQLIHGDREVFSQVLFGTPSMEMQNYIQQTQQNFMGGLTDVGRQFAEATRDMFARIDTSAAMNIARAALRKVNILFQEDVITPITTINDLQAVPDCMVPFIMQHPIIRELYLNGDIDGYNGRYFDPQPTLPSGWGHYHYDLLHSGYITIQQDEDGNEYDEFTEAFFENESEYENILPEERAILFEVLDNVVNQAIYEGRDPTSIYDSQLVR